MFLLLVLFLNIGYFLYLVLALIVVNLNPISIYLTLYSFYFIFQQSFSLWSWRSALNLDRNLLIANLAAPCSFIFSIIIIPIIRIHFRCINFTLQTSIGNVHIFTIETLMRTDIQISWRLILIVETFLIFRVFNFINVFPLFCSSKLFFLSYFIFLSVLIFYSILFYQVTLYISIFISFVFDFSASIYSFVDCNLFQVFTLLIYEPVWQTIFLNCGWALASIHPCHVLLVLIIIGDSILSIRRFYLFFYTEIFDIMTMLTPEFTEKIFHSLINSINMVNLFFQIQLSLSKTIEILFIIILLFR